MRQGNKGPWFKMQAADGSAEIQILNEIGFWGVTLEEFKAEFDTIRGSDSIRLLINSPGGDVAQGIALYNLLSGVRAKLTVEIMGIAASVASVVALAGSKLIMGEGTYLMIHDPWGVAIGTADDMLKMAEVLEKMRGEFAGIYAAHSDLSKDEVLAAMADETWYTADEAIAAGLADEVVQYEEPAVALSFDAARQQVIESMVNMKLEMSRLKRETEGALRDAGFSKSRATAETARIFDRRDDDIEARSESEDGKPKPDDDGMVLAGRSLRARIRTTERRKG